MHLFCAEKSFVNIVALRMALFKDLNGIYWWFRHDQKVFSWAQPRWPPVRKNSVGLGESGKGSRSRPAARSRDLAARPQLGVSTVADVGAEARPVAPGPE